MIIIGHRGCIYELENTLKSFKKALEIGANGIEVDTQKTLDDKIIISHDSNLKRVFGIDLNIREKEYKEISNLSLIDKILTLEECLEFVHDENCFIDIEIKNPTDFPYVLKIVSNFKYKNLIISSFFHKEIFEFKKYYPEISFAYLYSHVPKNLNEYLIEVQFLKPNINFLVNEYKKISKNVITWVVNEEKDIELVKNFDLFGVITDFPDKFKNVDFNNHYLFYFSKTIVKEESFLNENLVKISLLNTLSNFIIEEIKLDNDILKIDKDYPFIWKEGEKIILRIDKFYLYQKLIFKIKGFGLFELELKDIVMLLTQ
jgi:glycerophosphoryl diester phosphodiesterase